VYIVQKVCEKCANAVLFINTAILGDAGLNSDLKGMEYNLQY